jgi:hypothetical protein
MRVKEGDRIEHLGTGRKGLVKFVDEPDENTERVGSAKENPTNCYCTVIWDNSGYSLETLREDHVKIVDYVDEPDLKAALCS